MQAVPTARSTHSRARPSLSTRLTLAACLAILTFEAGAAVDFNREIRPILSGYCFKCHGPDEETREADLRLDVRDDALLAAESGAFAIVPGDPESSELLARVSTHDEDDVMPPPSENKQLSGEQIEVLRQWILEGANYAKHWAYEAPVRPPLPEVEQADWPRNDLDHFVLARLEDAGLKPNAEAPRHVLIRRLSLDLTGLPPTPEEVEDFVADERPDAYERLVERLLASPHHGEHQARPWLDMARFADTNGYEADNRRSNWPYRDWVIGAFNRDLAFDQFTIEQLAGDLLPNATLEQRIATGFHRNTMVNTEGGTDDEEFRVAALFDRVNTTFTVWQGTTMGCAQCHTHKYDPFTQKEYYQTLAILNQTTDGGKNNNPQLQLPTPEQEARQSEINAKIEPLQKQLDTQTPELDELKRSWETGLRESARSIEAAWRVLTPEGVEATGGVTLSVEADASVFSDGELPDNALYTITTTADITTGVAFRLQMLTDDRLPHGSSGRHEEGDFTLTDFSVLIKSADGSAAKEIGFDFAYADHSMNRYGVEKAIDDDENTGWAIAAYEERNRVDRTAVFVADEPFGFGPGTICEIRLDQNSPRAKHLLGRFRLSVGSGDRVAHRALADVSDPMRPIAIEEPAARSDGERDKLARYHRSITPALADVREQVKELRDQLPKDIASTLVLEAVEKPRETHVMIRGSFLNKGEKVEPAVPAVLNPWPQDEPVNRLTFARWLVSPENPLTARVTMNRIWAGYFGTGIVLTSEEFGSQGEPPSHPELLDWLAVEFMDRGWSLREMHREIVMSATYRQASTATAEKLAQDPFNRLFSRGPRFRMSGEILRDYALSVSGLLDPKLGGPSVFPHQPEGVWNNPYSSDRWNLSEGGDQFRRGLYTFWRRTSPYPAFMAFDAPSREVTCERRARSNTPVQSLVTLNDPAFYAAANGLARRIVKEAGETFEKRVDKACLLVLSRHATESETRHLRTLHQSALKKYASDTDAARRLISVGLPDANDESAPENVAELAAWSVIANVLLNLDEALTKG